MRRAAAFAARHPPPTVLAGVRQNPALSRVTRAGDAGGARE